jgi:hypothetical protein
VLPTLKVDPPDVGRGSVSIGQDVKRSFAILSRDAEPVAIESLTLGYVGPEGPGGAHGGRSNVALAGVQLTTTTEAEGHKVGVELSFRAPMAPGRYQVQVRLCGQRGPDDVLVVPIHFEVTPD